MRSLKSVLLGAGAGLLTVVGAQAADLPIKAKPVEYVKVCNSYGAGFFYIPGTDTCLKVGGYLRADHTYGDGGNQSAYYLSNANARHDRLDTDDESVTKPAVIAGTKRLLGSGESGPLFAGMVNFKESMINPWRYEDHRLRLPLDLAPRRRAAHRPG